MADVGELDEDKTTDDVEGSEDEETDNGSEGATGGDADEDPEVKRLRAALAKSRKANAKLRAAGKQGASNGTPAATGAEDVETLKRAEREKVEGEYAPRLKRAAAKSALAGAGLMDSDKPEVLKRAVRLLDLDDLELDEDGDVEGLDEAIADLKAEFPTMFQVKRVKGRVSTSTRTTTVAGKDGTSTKKPVSSASKLAAQLK